MIPVAAYIMFSTPLSATSTSSRHRTSWSFGTVLRRIRMVYSTPKIYLPLPYVAAYDCASMRFLSLRDGTPHKRARFTNLHMSISHFFPDGNPSDELFVFDVSSVQLSGEYALLCASQCRNVIVLNWVTGRHWVSLTVYAVGTYLQP